MEHHCKQEHRRVCAHRCPMSMAKGVYVSVEVERRKSAQEDADNQNKGNQPEKD